MFDFDALNPAFQDAEAELPDIYDEDGVCDFSNEFGDEYDEELYGDMYEGHDGHYYDSWDFDG